MLLLEECRVVELLGERLLDVDSVSESSVVDCSVPCFFSLPRISLLFLRVSVTGHRPEVCPFLWQMGQIQLAEQPPDWWPPDWVNASPSDGVVMGCPNVLCWFK